MSSDARRRYHVDGQRERYNTRRDAALVALGGKCAKCGSTEDLEFDHVDPASKKYEVSTMFSKYSAAKIAEELEKCQLLCKPHHQEKTKSENRRRKPWNKGLKLSGRIPSAS
jgi:5-methylcytosine-specific restriction endonuclease McrA